MCSCVYVYQHFLLFQVKAFCLTLKAIVFAKKSDAIYDKHT